MNAPTHAKSAQVYIFSGEDDYLLVQDAKSLVNRLLPPEEQTLGLEIIEAHARNAAEAGASIVRCIEALRTPGFMGSRKIIWLRGANFLDRSLLARTKEVSELMPNLAGIISSSLPKDNIFVVTANAIDKAASFFKACHAKGEIHEQEAIKPWHQDKAAAIFTRSILQKNKLQAPPAVTEAIVALVGNDSRQLVQEVEKLTAFVYPSQKATEDDVLAIVSAARENNSFNLADAVGFRDLPRAIAILRQLFFQNENEIGITMGLESRFRYLLILREMTSEKTSSGEKSALEPLLVPEKGRPPQGYYLEKLVKQSKLFSRQELASAREAILKTRLKLVSSSGLAELLLEKLIVKLCRRQKGR